MPGSLKPIRRGPRLLKQEHGQKVLERLGLNDSADQDRAKEKASPPGSPRGKPQTAKPTASNAPPAISSDIASAMPWSAVVNTGGDHHNHNQHHNQHHSPSPTGPQRSPPTGGRGVHGSFKVGGQAGGEGVAIDPEREGGRTEREERGRGIDPEREGAGGGEAGGGVSDGEKRAQSSASSIVPQRETGKDKGTVIWKIMKDYGDVLVREGDDFKAAVEAAQPGARIFLTEGMHTWSGIINLDKCVQIIGAGAWITVLKGKWRLGDYAPPLSKKTGEPMLAESTHVRLVFEDKRPRVGGFSGLEIRWMAGEGRRVNLQGSYLGETMVITGGTWRFLSCKVTCSGAPPVVMNGRSDVAMLECRVGGIGADPDDKSSSGIIVQGECSLSLHTCTLEHTDSLAYKGVECKSPTKQQPSFNNIAETPLSQSVQTPPAPVGGPGTHAQHPEDDESALTTVAEQSVAVAVSGEGGEAETGPSEKEEGGTVTKKKGKKAKGGAVGVKGGGEGEGEVSATSSSAIVTSLTRATFVEDWTSSAILVRHTSSIEVDCCQFLHNVYAISMAEASHAKVWDCLIHEHNEGGIFGILSKGDKFRESCLDVRDNKIARSQDKARVAAGRPGRYTRRDGENLMAREMAKESGGGGGALDSETEKVKAAHARLESLFDTEKALFTTMALTFR